jgi:hypothetical protein
MKAGLPLLLAISMILLTGATPAPSPDPYASYGSADLVKITPAPLKMKTDVAILCAQATYPISPSIHSDKFFDVYITSGGVPIIKSGKGTYPQGTVILKKKYSDAEGKDTELYTGMIKRTKGFNPQGGDWEYFVLAGDGKTVTQTGALTSCMECHQAYRASDFVTREYLTESFLYHSKDKN